jgi:hypothetical protein
MSALLLQGMDAEKFVELWAGDDLMRHRLFLPQKIATVFRFADVWRKCGNFSRYKSIFLVSEPVVNGQFLSWF